MDEELVGWVARRLQEGEDYFDLPSHGVYTQEQIRDGIEALSELPPEENSDARSFFYWPLSETIQDSRITIRECGAWTKDPKARSWGSATKVRALNAAGWKPRTYSTASYRNERLSVSVGAGWQDSHEMRVKVLAVSVVAWTKGKFKKHSFDEKREILSETFNEVAPGTWHEIEDWLVDVLENRIK